MPNGNVSHASGVDPGWNKGDEKVFIIIIIVTNAFLISIQEYWAAKAEQEDVSPRNLDKFLAETASKMTTSLTQFRNNSASKMRMAAASVYGFAGISSSPSAFVDGR